MMQRNKARNLSNARRKQEQSHRSPRFIRRNPRHASRRGILLLVVLTMLTLFLLIGTTYLVSADYFRKANKSYATATQTQYLTTDHGTLLDEALGQLIRDTNNPFSSLRFHSLLRDMYGNDGVKIGPNDGVDVQLVDRNTFSFTYTNEVGDDVSFNANDLDTSMENTGDQFFWVAASINLNNVPAGLLPTLNTNKSYYNGRVLTILSGELANISSRIVEYDYFLGTNGSDGFAMAVFTLLPLNAEQQIFSRAVTDNALVSANTTVLINGQPYNGTGVGYNSLATMGPRLNGKEDVLDSTGTLNPLELALLPHSAFTAAQNLQPELLFTNLELVALDFYNLDEETQIDLMQSRFQSLGIGGLGGSDESYDAPDFQNMALAMMPREPGDLWNGNSGSLENMVLPSFHRPALINYWYQNNGLVDQQTGNLNPNMLRKVLLRPNWIDHPNFTGSNLEYAQAITPSNLSTNPDDPVLRMIYGPWDVDNDNDGRRDSMWVDFGAPIMTTKDGTRVKPLAALLVLDMDGRLNVNAHGSLEHYRRLTGTEEPAAQTLASNVTTRSTPLGQGYGPADISLNELFIDNENAVDENAVDANAMRELFLGTGETPGRYGFVPDENADARLPGRHRRYDLQAQLKLQGTPAYFLSENHIRSAYVSPPDLHGRYGFGLNDLGQPVYEAIDDILVPLDLDSPYELSLSLNATTGEDFYSHDAAYSTGELERLLRIYDADASQLPSRLASFTNILSDASKRNIVTTDSYDLPVPSVTVPQWMVQNGYENVMGKSAVGATFLDLLEYKIRVAIGLSYDSGKDPEQLAQDSRTIQALMKGGQASDGTYFRPLMVGQDLSHGIRMDINRPMGNGRDDDGNGVVDEPGENEGAFWFLYGENDRDSTGDTAATSTAAMEYQNVNGIYRDLIVDRNGGDIDGEDGVIEPWDSGDLNESGFVGDTVEERILVHNRRRQDMARDLFVLAMTLVEPIDTTPADPASEEDKERIRKLAQWAINCVDFCDPDNIMTAFEYDENPFNGWNVDGDLSTDDNGSEERAVVWGTERPELLITETLGWHDRRVTDTGNEIADPGEERGTVNEGKDEDYDQRYPPRGYGFIELYNPWPENPAANADTHAIAGLSRRDPTDGTIENDWDNDGTSNDNFGRDMGINIGAVSTYVDPGDGETYYSPVWRIVVYKLGGPGKDPDEEELENQPLDFGFNHRADRSIYFTHLPFEGNGGLNAVEGGFQNEMVSFGNDGVPFYSSEDVPCVAPGGYMVVGSGEPQPESGEYLAIFGEEVTAGEQRGIMLNKIASTAIDRVKVVSKFSDPLVPKMDEGTPVQDVAGFSMVARKDNNVGMSVELAIIDRSAMDPKPASDPTGFRRFSFSEPAYGYPTLIQGEIEYVPPRDVPLDDQRLYRGNALTDNGDLASESARLQDGETRLTLPDGSETGGRTVPALSWVYLQRLANPMLPWNPVPSDSAYDPNKVVNPYLTVDDSGANVTVFNGQDNKERRWPEGADRENIHEMQEYFNFDAIEGFSSLQRGRANASTQPGTNLQQLQEAARGAQAPAPVRAALVPTNLWTPEAIGGVSPGPFAGFWLNQAGPNPETTPGADDNSSLFNFQGIPDCTLGFLNEPYRADGAASEEDWKRTPDQPFPWLNWNNRPFISSNEIMQVPGYRSSQLLRAYSFNGTNSPQEIYDEAVTEIELSSTLSIEIDGPYGHLMNFFRSSNSTSEETNVGISGLHRILDYLHVPSRFVDTEIWLNPAAFGSVEVTSDTDPRYGLQPPFNRIPTFREPGRVNLNTISDQAVWQGLFHGTPENDMDGSLEDDMDGSHPGPSWGTFSGSRGNGGNSILQLDNQIPSFFENPFRSPDAQDLVPVSEMVINNTTDCTLFRKASLDGGESQFALFGSDLQEPYQHAFRNSYFRYHPLTRLDNLTTNRSHVYAVWITVGFFEVEEFDEGNAQHQVIIQQYGDGTLENAVRNPLFNQVYPEGYMYGREAGLDTGEVHRVREFAIIDRSIPVAFESGTDHNVDEAIRLRRRLE